MAQLFSKRTVRTETSTSNLSIAIFLRRHQEGTQTYLKTCTERQGSFHQHRRPFTFILSPLVPSHACLIPDLYDLVFWTICSFSRHGPFPFFLWLRSSSSCQQHLTSSVRASLKSLVVSYGHLCAYNILLTFLY